MTSHHIEREAGGTIDDPGTLDPLTLPLQGSSLIEASAGTGKTYTIASLYIRLVLGDREDGAAGMPLHPKNILVMTFTDAATAELRERIRSRLSKSAEYYAGNSNLKYARLLLEAANSMDEAAIFTIHSFCLRMLTEHAFDSGGYFEPKIEDAKDISLDEVIRDYWREHYYGLNREKMSVVLNQFKNVEALRSHIKCRLEYTDAIFRGNSGNRSIISTGVDAILDEYITNIVRLKQEWLRCSEELKDMQRIGAKSKLIDTRRFKLQWLDELDEWAKSSDSEKMLKDSKLWCNLLPDTVVDLVVKPACADSEFATELSGCAALKVIQDINDVRTANILYKPLLLHALNWVKRRHQEWKQSAGVLAFDDMLVQLARALDSDNGERLAATIKAQYPVALIDEFQDTDPVQYSIISKIYGPGTRALENNSENALLMIGDPKQAIYSFRGADIYTYLEARNSAVKHYTLGTNYRSTRKMVDAVNDLFEFGEGLRLAQTDGEQGVFRMGCIARKTQLPFRRLLAKGREDTFYIDNKEHTGLYFGNFLDCGENADAVDRNTVIADECAEMVKRLLCLSSEGKAGFGTKPPGEPSGAPSGAPSGEPGDLKPLKEADVAVLVNDYWEAAYVKKALGDRGIRSVYLSDSDTVFQSPLAADFLRILAACLNSSDDRIVKAALIGPIISLSPKTIHALTEDELLMESYRQHFAEYSEVWKKKGVLPMITRLMDDFHIPVKLLQNDSGQYSSVCDKPDRRPGGERDLTDLMHLAELCQELALKTNGQAALLREYEKLLNLKGYSGELSSQPYRQRLESDEALVKIITIFKAKGLEYPLVFLPFALNAKAITGGSKIVTIKRFVKWHDDDNDGRLMISNSREEALAAVEKANNERLAEDIRKLYVGVTRARYFTWVGMAPYPQRHQSGLGSVIGMDIKGDQIPQFVKESTIKSEDIKTSCATPDTRTSCDNGASRQMNASLPGRLRQKKYPVDHFWNITSYSGIVRNMSRSQFIAAPSSGREQAPETVKDVKDVQDCAEPRNFRDYSACDDMAPDAADIANLVESMEGSHLESDETISPERNIHNVPAGATTGNFLHSLLEKAADDGFDKALKISAEPNEDAANKQGLLWEEIYPGSCLSDSFRDIVEKRCGSGNMKMWTTVLIQWMTTILGRKWKLPAVAGGPAESRITEGSDITHQDASEAGFRLAELQIYQPEMEFMFEISAGDSGVTTGSIDALMASWPMIEGAGIPALNTGHLKGMLKGFIDLVFEYDGRYYVADYKSNRLGPDDGAYSRDNLGKAMLMHRYDLQMVLYVLALHRHLKYRLDNYSYDDCMGGGVYLFLRGCQNPHTGGAFAFRPARRLIESLDALFGGQP